MTHFTEKSCPPVRNPHPHPLPCLRRSGFAQAGVKGEGNYRVITSLAIEAFLIQETNIAQGLPCLTERSSKSDEVEVQ
jgi:hypothetical protein